MSSKIIKICLAVSLAIGFTSSYALSMPPVYLVGIWQETTSTNPDPDVVVMNADNTLSFAMGRQVGRQGSDIPFPTTCYYKQYGSIHNMTFKGNEIDIFYHVDHTKLIKPEGSSTYEICEKFVRTEHDVYYHWRIKMLDPKTVQDTWYKTVYHKKS